MQMSGEIALDTSVAVRFLNEENESDRIQHELAH
ncbi:hypothetical protein NIES3585_29780 [Nodularia sp. NIES-3585]|nr:hypothetical protein NIES3585_29780 [Nodularia sp. NIES-3585]